MGRKDDWEIKRSTTQKFTADEKALIEKRFKEGVLPQYVARELLASSRTIQTHFTKLREKGVQGTPRSNHGPIVRKRDAEIPYRVKRPAPPKHTRFYHSTFEPS